MGKKTDNYTVGYKKPPKQHRFKKGTSGNPKGRPKRSQNLITIIREELERKVVLTENGQTFRLNKAQAICKRLVNQGLLGNMNAIKTLINIAGPEETLDDIFELNDEHRQVFKNLLERVGTDPLLNQGDDAKRHSDE